MKKTTLFSCFFLLMPFFVFSQALDADANVYLFEQFSAGKALMKNGSVETAEFNYDVRNKSIVFKKDSQVLTLTGLADIDTIYINDKKFVAIDNVPYEVVTSAPVALLVTYDVKAKPLTATTDHNGTSTQSSNAVNNSLSGAYLNKRYQGKYEYEIRDQFWLKKEDRLYKANTEKQIRNLLTEKSTEINNYIKNYKPDFNNKNDLTRLINYFNTL